MVKEKIPQNNDKCNIEEGARLTMNVPFFMSPNNIIYIEDTFTGYEKFLYLILCCYANNNTAAFPSLNTLVKKSGFSKPTVIKAVNGLIEKGVIVKQTVQSTTGQYSRNIYHVNYDLPGGVVKDVYQGGKGRLPGVVKDVDLNNNYINNNYKESVEQPEKPPARSTSSNNQKPKSAVKELIGYYIDLYHEKNREKPVIVKGQDHGIIKNLVTEYGEEKTRLIIAEHVNEPDQWTRERGSSISTINHNMPAYLERIKKAQADKEQEQRQRAAMEALNRRDEEKERQRQKEQAEWEALPELEKAQRNLSEYIESRKPLREIYQPKADQGDQHAINKLKEYDEKEAELKQAVLNADNEKIAAGV